MSELICEFEFPVRAWAGWLPGVESADEWRRWAVDQQTGEERPCQLSEIPAVWRRRLSTLGKTVLSCAGRVLDPQQPLPQLVFASRHGEIVRSEAMLAAIAAREPISPKHFSMSVHNNIVGLYGVVTGNRQAMHAIAGAADTWTAACVQAAALLQEQEQVLLLLGEESAQAYFSAVMPPQETPWALALLLDRSVNDPLQAQLHSRRPSTNESGKSPEALRFVRWLLSKKAHCRLSGHSRVCDWQRLHIEPFLPC